MAGQRTVRYKLALIGAVAGAAIVAASALAADARTLALGSTLTITGQTGSRAGKTTRATGLVAIVKSWAGSPTLFHTFARTDPQGRYRVTMTPPHRGLLRVVITPPDRHPVRYLLRVV